MSDDEMHEPDDGRTSPTIDDEPDGRLDPDGPLETEGGDAERRWPLHWYGLYPRERWIWFERLWGDVCSLRGRYRLAVRSCWWEDSVAARGAGRHRGVGGNAMTRGNGRSAGEARAAVRAGASGGLCCGRAGGSVRSRSGTRMRSSAIWSRSGASHRRVTC